MPTIEPRTVIIFWMCSPISFKHMSFWTSMLKAILKYMPLKYRYTSKEVTKLGFSTLAKDY